jgi:streptogramin lyase
MLNKKAAMRIVSIMVILLALQTGCREGSTGSSSPVPLLSSPTVFVPVGIVKSPRGIAVDSTGDIWVSDTRGDRVLRLAPSGSARLSMPLTLPGGMGVDHLTGDILVVSAGTSLWRINPRTENASNEANLSTLPVDTSAVFDVNVREVRTKAVSISQVGGIGGTITGDIYISAASGNENYLIKVRGGTASAAAYSSAIPPTAADAGPRFIATDRFGTIYTSFAFASGSGSQIRVFAFHPNSLSLSHILGEPAVTGGARGATIDATGILFIADPAVDAIVIVSTSNERTLGTLSLPSITGIVQPVARDIAVAPDGTVYVAVSDLFDSPEFPGAVLRYGRR